MLQHWQRIGLSLLAIMLVGYLAVYGFKLPPMKIQAEQIEGLLWPQQKQLSEFGLTDHTGGRFNLASLSDSWNLLFFGFTHCPDICPLTMTTLQQTVAILNADKAAETPDVKMIFIAVDAERDVTAQLANYIDFYGETFLAASGSKAEVDSLATQLGVAYAIEPHNSGDNYLVSHSGALFFVSPDGKLFAVIQPPHAPLKLAAKLQAIQKFIWQQR